MPPFDSPPLTRRPLVAMTLVLVCETWDQGWKLSNGRAVHTTVKFEWKLGRPRKLPSSLAHHLCGLFPQKDWLRTVPVYISHFPPIAWLSGQIPAHDAMPAQPVSAATPGPYPRGHGPAAAIRAQTTPGAHSSKLCRRRCAVRAARLAATPTKGAGATMVGQGAETSESAGVESTRVLLLPLDYNWQLAQLQSAHGLLWLTKRLLLHVLQASYFDPITLACAFDDCGGTRRRRRRRRQQHLGRNERRRDKQEAARHTVGEGCGCVRVY
mgnify:CR=1 FL=1